MVYRFHFGFLKQLFFLPASLVLFSLYSQGVSNEAPLLICIPGGMSPAKIDSVIAKVISPQPVMAFQRIKDLEQVLSSYPKAPIIGSGIYVKYLPGYTILLQGKKGNEKQKKYLIISSNPKVNRTNISTYKVGILDFLGREKLPLFVQDAFGFSIPKLNRVTKKEDLLTLLGMESVDAAIIEESDLAEIRAGTKIKMLVLIESKPMEPLPVFACPEKNNCADLRKKLMVQPKVILQTLAIEGWE